MRASSWLAVLLPVAWLACSASDGGSPSDPNDRDASGDMRADGGARKPSARDGGGVDAGGVGGSRAGGSGGTGGSAPEDAPINNALTVLFGPMYSAFDGQHAFQVPAIVPGVTDLAWSARPADAVQIEPDLQTGGVLITTRRAGDVQIIARAGPLNGAAMLHVTATTPELWQVGEQRYRARLPFPDFDGADAGPFVPAGFQLPGDLSCRGCHGPGAQALDIEHTPQQTGGYSDDLLIQIITTGTRPPGARFHTMLPPSLFAFFHTWDATTDEKRGLVTYMRSLLPKSQGPLDFQGKRF